MELQKSHWETDGANMRLSMPFTKTDKENRLVSGFATLDNVDQQGDIVLASASSKAFGKFRGNIREMHQPIAAGRLADFKEDEFYDSETEQVYKGVYVTAYVSKGAQDTWEKVLDGTLTGFSIGGAIVDSENQFDKSTGSATRVIKDYNLVELSLVDSPANQLANVFSITKSADGEDFMKGMIMKTTVQNVFWCENDKIARESGSENMDCITCGGVMKNIGWHEDGTGSQEEVRGIVAKFLRQEGDNAQNESASGEGGVTMTDEIKKDADVISTDTVATEEGDDKATAVEEAGTEGTAAEAGDASEAAKAAEAEEASTDPDLTKMFDDLKNAVDKSLESSKEDVERVVKAVEGKVDEVKSAFDEKASEFEKSLTELSERLDSVKNEREEVTKRLDALEKATAIKKSGEVETPPEKKLQKGLWSGTFLDN